MSQAYDVAIVGAGVVGLAAAVAMRQRQYSVALIDAGSFEIQEQEVDPRVYAINRTSQNLFEAMGVWEHIAVDRLSPYRKMHIWDGQHHAHLDFDSRTIGQSYLGHIIEESAIKEALLAKAKALGVCLVPDTKVSDLDEEKNGVQIHCGNSDIIFCKLLIAADGARSRVRDIFGIPLTSWSYRQKAIVASVEVEKPHEMTAYQVFHQEGPIAFLPLSDPHRCSIVWSTSPERAEALMSLDNKQFAFELARSFSSKLGACQLVGQRYQFPLTMRHVKQYHGHSWILMGDAAHTIHPLAGLGLNVGLADLGAWLKIIDAPQKTPWLLKTKATYQRQRKSAVWKVIALMQTLKTLFGLSVPIVNEVRGVGLTVANHIPLLKRFFIEQASGENL